MANARIKVTPMRALVCLLSYTYRLYAAEKVLQAEHLKG